MEARSLPAKAGVWNPTRSSFAKGCLRTVVSKMGLEIEVAYYERKKGVLVKVTEVLINAKDAPLSETLMSALPEAFQGLARESESIIRCYAGDIGGEELNLDHKPKEIDYIIDAVRNEDKPFLFVCKESLADEERCETPDSDYYSLPSRCASGMVMDLIGNVEAVPSPLAISPGFESPSTPPTPGSASSEGGYLLVNGEGRGEKSKTLPASRRPRGMPTKALSLGTSIREELYNIQDSLIPFDQSIFNDDPYSPEEEPPSPISEDIPREWKTPGLDILSRSVDSAAGAWGGFLTLRPSRKKKANHSRNRKTLMPTSSKSIDITPPSPVDSPRAFGGQCTRRRKWERPGQGEGKGGDKKPWPIRTTAIRRKKHKSSVPESPPIPEMSFAFQIVSVTVIKADGSSLSIPCREHSTILDLKETVSLQMNKKDLSRLTCWKPSDFVLTYKVDGKEFEFFNDLQFIFKTALYASCVEQQDTAPNVYLHEIKPGGADRDLQVAYRTSQLAGVMMDDKISVFSLPGADLMSLRRIADADRDEVQWARRTLHSFVNQVTNSRDPDNYALSRELVTRGTSTILALKIPIDNKVEITFHYKHSFSLVKRINVQKFADSVLAEVFPCIVACKLVEDSCRVGDYTLQISGEKSYVAGKLELIRFKDIRRCITKGEPIHFSITEKPNVEEDKVLELNWLPIDPHSGDPPLHNDITQTPRRDCQLQALSVWDREEEFTLRVIMASNLPVVTKSLSQKPSAVVEATLYHGDKPLCPSVSTAARQLDHTTRWKETLNFHIAKKNIPKAAKLMFVIREPIHRRESVNPRKASPRFLYWGLSTIYDHQSMMHNGEKVMTLWRGDKNKDKDKDSHEESFPPNSCGPASSNPDPKAVTLYVKFDSYGFPLYYPSTDPQSWSGFLRQESGHVAVRRQFQRLLEFIKEGRLHSALPSYVEKVRWGSLAESLEVYSLLDQISAEPAALEHFPVETALKLLDCNFPDENVRGFATQVLEQLPDEQLEDFLLQLTQALKFEHNHDSQLARFLLKRALRNKRIGHFFFWYLKCELHTLQYTARFGVILEAYLKGCGEAMLKRFEDQVGMQTKLEEIGRELKILCNDDQGKMQAMLPEMLERRGVPQFTLTPVYNPRITLGNLRPTKCKIMGSKKKPQWLEMYNVDPTALRHTPTRLILKLGDDLRQDMITLGMFSLFEKLWEEDGLDCAVIPYGCIATGPNTGFIEVVKNAMTIADVSGVSKNTKLYEWIKKHQTNEFGEIDPDKVKTAVKTFVHSCAGYSVATYVLGIGDRHNDNIMVTTSGNLFHIDFGHFLGNIKYCMGFKREWAPFVLTPDFVYVMGGEESSTFEMYKDLCCRAFLILRRHAHLIINLFSMMRSTGIPELTCVEDTDYIKNALLLGRTELEAMQSFQKVIQKCLDLKWTVQVMWKFHLFKRKNS